MQDKKTDLAQKVNVKLSEVMEIITTCEKEETRNEQVTAADEANISERGKYLKAEIDNAECRFIERRRKLEQARRELLQQNTKTYESYSLQLQQCREDFKSEKFEDIVTAETELNQLLYNKTLPIVHVPEELFTSHVVNDQQMDRMFGELWSKEFIPKPQQSLNGVDHYCMARDVKVLSLFENSEGVGIWSLCSTDNDKVWVVLNEGNEVQKNIKLVTIMEVIEQTVNIGQKVMDVCVDEKGAIFACCPNNEVCQLIGKQDKHVRRRTIPFSPSSLCIKSTGELIICYTDESKVAMHESRGKHIKSVGRDARYNNIIIDPNIVRMNNKTGDIAIISSGLSSVVVLDSEMTLRFLYNGTTTYTPDDIQTSDIKKTEFEPLDVIFDADNNVLFSDGARKSVIMLNREGQNIRSLYVDKFKPKALALNNDGKLWVGYQNGIIKLIEY